MTATFLHDDKTIPAGEELDLHPPACPACGTTMWLVHFTRRSSDDGEHDVRSYECKKCGALKDVVGGEPLEPSA
jgi:predicted RNA-binding Zn-ribbon protein involved in translation (DUF1610 family)